MQEKEEEKEIWKIYEITKKATWEVSNYGRVKKNGQLYECRKSGSGYLMFGRGIYLHKAVGTLFVENLNNYNELDHIDGNKLNNFYLNLRWCSHKQNCNNPLTRQLFSKVRKGLFTREKNPFYGKKHTPDAKAKLSNAFKGRHIVLCEDGKRHWV